MMLLHKLGTNVARRKRNSYAWMLDAWEKNSDSLWREMIWSVMR